MFLQTDFQRQAAGMAGQTVIGADDTMTGNNDENRVMPAAQPTAWPDMRGIPVRTAIFGRFHRSHHFTTQNIPDGLTESGFFRRQ